jgi:glycosyltransferase involved in cell wall biosynthesis
MSRLAWFTPLPPTKSGIAQYNRELLPHLSDSHHIDVFVDGRASLFASPDARVRLFDAHDFLWKHHREPYDLIVYQLGNATCHDYMWSYLVRFPGLVVLHDGQLHHARGRMLLQRWIPKQEEYRQEFWFNHPDVNPDLAQLGAAGLLGSLTYLLPMLRIVVETSRRVLVHNTWLAEQIRAAHPDAIVDVVEMGVPEPVLRRGARARIRARHHISDEAVVFTAFGKVTPEKRVREAMRAIAAIAPAVPRAHLLIAGENVEYYDMRAEAEALGIGERVTLAGYVPDEEIDDCLDASDVCLCMRWPTSRETSASWMRCVAAGKPTISTDLVHTTDVSTLDPRDWSILAGLKAGTASDAKPVGVSIDILDEDHSLKLAIRRLASDEKLRATLAGNARALWTERFGLEQMVAGYQAAMTEAMKSTGPSPAIFAALPEHLRSTGEEYAESLVREILGSEYHLRDAD